MLCNACGLYWRNHRTMRPLDFILKPRSPSVATLLARDPSLTPAARNHAIEESRKLLDNAKCLKKMMQKAQNSKKTKKQLKRDTFKAERKDEPIDYASQSDDNWRPLPKVFS